MNDSDWFLKHFKTTSKVHVQRVVFLDPKFDMIFYQGELFFLNFKKNSNGISMTENTSVQSI